MSYFYYKGLIHHLKKVFCYQLNNNLKINDLLPQLKKNTLQDHCKINVF